MKLILTSLILLHYLMNCDGRPDGAPVTACATLMPVHNRGPEAGKFEPSKNESPYAVSAVSTTDNKVKVTISSKDQGFQGFVLQARSKTDPTKFVSGQFTKSPGTRTIDCFNKDKSTLTHADTSEKNQVVTEWRPAPGVNEEVVFRATVAKTYDLFWTEQDSQPISIHSGMTDTEEDKIVDMDHVYHDCSKTKGCFGFPEGCIHAENCKILLTYYSVPSGVNFSLHGNLDSLRYMAVGLSEDRKMGEDSVNECIRDKSDVTVRESWNVGKSNTQAKELSSSDQFHGQYLDGLSFCYWVKSYQFESGGKIFDLVNNSYYLLLAMGEVREGGGLAYHNGDRIASIENLNLTRFENLNEEIDSSSEIYGMEFEPSPPHSTEPGNYGDVTTPSVPNDTPEQDTSHGSHLSFNAFYVILALLLAVRGVKF